MYTLTADGRTVARTAADVMAFVPGSTLTERVSCAAQAVVTLRPDNPYTGYIATRKSVIVIERAGAELFRGQAIDRLENEQGFVRFSLLGEMSFLRDALVAPFEFTGSASNLIGTVLSDYNAQAAAPRQIARGTVSKTGLGSSITYSNTSYRSAWDILSDLYSRYGGLLRVRAGDSGRVLDWMDDSGHFCSQVIMQGDNLLKLNVTQDASGVVNSIRGTAGQDLSVLVEDAASIARFGRVRVHRTYDAETSTALTALVNADLADAKDEALQVAGYAVDRWWDGREPFRVGDFARTVSRVPYLDQYVMVSELKHDLTGGTPTQVTLGVMPASLTRTARSGIINAWIIGAQGRAPVPLYALDINNRLAFDCNGVYGTAKGA